VCARARAHDSGHIFASIAPFFQKIGLVVVISL